MTRGSSSAKAKAKATDPIELVNPGTAGIVYDTEGRSVGGGDRATLPGDPDPVAMRQLEAGHLLAQRGGTWLAVRDGQPADPNPPATDSTAGSSPAGELEPPTVPEPRGDGGE